MHVDREPAVGLGGMPGGLHQFGHPPLRHPQRHQRGQYQAVGVERAAPADVRGRIEVGGLGPGEPSLDVQDHGFGRRHRAEAFEELVPLGDRPLIQYEIPRTTKSRFPSRTG